MYPRILRSHCFKEGFDSSRLFFAIKAHRPQHDKQGPLLRAVGFYLYGEACIIRIGFWAHYTIIYNKEPPKIVQEICEAPILNKGHYTLWKTSGRRISAFCPPLTSPPVLRLWLPHWAPADASQATPDLTAELRDFCLSFQGFF